MAESGGGGGGEAGPSGNGAPPPIVPGIVVEDPLHPSNPRTAKKRQDQMAAGGCFEAGNCIYLKRPENETNRSVFYCIKYFSNQVNTYIWPKGRIVKSNL